LSGTVQRNNFAFPNSNMVGSGPIIMVLSFVVAFIMKL